MTYLLTQGYLIWPWDEIRPVVGATARRGCDHFVDGNQTFQYLYQKQSIAAINSINTVVVARIQ